MFDQAEELRKLSKQAKLDKNGLPRTPPRIITVTSGKGGVGKTNIVTNLALALTDYKKRVMVVDADLGLANIDVLIGILPKFNIQHVIQGYKGISEIMIEGPKGIKIIPAASGVKELSNLSNQQTDGVISKFAELEGEADIMLIDTSAGLSWNVLSFVLAAREVIVVTTPDPTAITDAYAMIKVISRECKNSQIAIRLIVNMANSQKEADEVAEKISVVAQKFLNINVSVLGHVYVDTNVTKAVKQQKPFVLAYPYSPATNCINFIAAKLCGYQPGLTEQENMEGFFRRMLDILKTKKTA